MEKDMKKNVFDCITELFGYTAELTQHYTLIIHQYNKSNKKEMSQLVKNRDLVENDDISIQWTTSQQ